MSSPTPTPSKRLVILCDGTWVGRETEVPGAPPSNIRMLGNMIGDVQFDKQPGQEPTKVHIIRTHQTNVTAGYQEGVGLNKTFLEYLWDGATASTIGDECVSVYKFIVDYYDDDHEIWLFGFSRGAFTVRCVSGMINNCGIIKRLPNLSDSDVSTLCHEVYRRYRSPLDIDHPQSSDCIRFRQDSSHVWSHKRPIRFLGLIDTVGALGIPRLNAGVGFDWPEYEFRDQKVSSVVQEVYHAPSLHDRLQLFQPCLVFPGNGDETANVHQKWFPGCHYDLGRQTFRFIRRSPNNPMEKVLGALPATLSRTIWPNEVLADVVLRWLLEAVRDIDSEKPNFIIPNIDRRIQELSARLGNPEKGTQGSGDIYTDILSYGPAGTVWEAVRRFGSSAISLLNRLIPKLGDNIQDLLGIKTILGILTATQDRRIPGCAEDVYPYKNEEMVQADGEERRFRVIKNARLLERDERGALRYPSRTYESFGLWRQVFGKR